jgi:hypothetical protein
MSDVHVAMMNLLWPRRGLQVQSFYDYWSGAHTQISSRLPGIHQYFQHHLDPVAGRAFPGSEKWADATTAGFFGDAEITFASAADLAEFAASLNPLMQDEQNVFEKTISYQAPGEFSVTLRDDCDDRSPNGDLGRHSKFMVYVQRSHGLDRDRFRSSFVSDVAAPLRDFEGLSKIRYRLVDYYDNDAVTLSAPNVDNFEAASNQFDACLELVFSDPFARRDFAGTRVQGAFTEALAQLASGVACMRALRTFTVYNDGRVTLAGLRTPQMAAQIMALGASNQLGEENYRLMLSEHTFSPRY